MNSLICLNVLMQAIICVDATTFVKFITTSRQLLGTVSYVTDIGPTATPLPLLSTCITKADCQAVDAQRQTLLTNVSGVSVTDGHGPTFISTVSSISFWFIAKSKQFSSSYQNPFYIWYFKYNLFFFWFIKLKKKMHILCRILFSVHMFSQRII